MSQLSALEYVRSGLTPFFRLEWIDPGNLAASGGAAAALLGVPFDSGVTYAPGARFAPWHVRRVSARVEGRHPHHRLNVFEALRAVDAGNVAFSPFDPSAMRERVCAEVMALSSLGMTPFLCGGDHSVALPALRALSARHGPLAVIHVDAHADTSGPEVWGAAHHHGTPFRYALQEGLIAKERLVQIGLRGPWAAEEESALAVAHGVRQVGMEEIEARGVRAVADEVRERVRGFPVYLSFDIDALDPAFAPGTGTPVPGGITSREALALLRGLRGIRLAGMDLVEVCPALDHVDATSLLAAQLLFEGLALRALSRD